MTYRISFHPGRGWRWWSITDALPPEEQHVRLATAEEAAVIERIRAAANRNQPADEAVAKFLELAATPLI